MMAVHHRIPWNNIHASSRGQTWVQDVAVQGAFMGALNMMREIIHCKRLPERFPLPHCARAKAMAWGLAKSSRGGQQDVAISHSASRRCLCQMAADRNLGCLVHCLQSQSEPLAGSRACHRGVPAGDVGSCRLGWASYSRRLHLLWGATTVGSSCQNLANVLDLQATSRPARASSMV